MKWEIDNPALGQCSVTALAIQDQFGGRILKTVVGDANHFYNEIEGNIYDFTASQFTEEVRCSDDPATREEALVDCTPEEYQELLSLFLSGWREKMR